MPARFPDCRRATMWLPAREKYFTRSGRDVQKLVASEFYIVWVGRSDSSVPAR